ncbi:MAG TPA: flagellar M-ring protein FliF [Gammaproteobacteria bacterium]|nr:flagellar M-ring protein FliF [Gammaproteobacteria bacterium]
MAEATLDSNQQALAPAGGGQVAARTNVPAALAAAGGLMDNTGQDTMDDIGVDGGPLSLLNNPDVQRILPYVIGVIALAICILFYLWVSAPTYRSVYPGMSEADRQEAKEALDAAGFSPRIDINSGALQVDDDRYHEARILLASQDIPRSATAGGFENLLEQGSMTTSRFMEQVSYRAAMETELAKSVTEIATIRGARVHLAEPQQSVFVRNQTPAKASVVVVPHPGRVVTQSQIRAIVHLVSSSVPYLPAENVSVVDNTGALLTDTEGENAMTLTNAQAEHKRSLEMSYNRRIEQILASIVGMGNVRSEVDVALDFTEVETTYEEFDKGGVGPRTRSESLDFEQEAAIGASGLPGSFSNQPPAAPDFAQSGNLPEESSESASGVSSSSTTRNYELDREIRYVKQQVGRIDRVSVAVVINQDAYISPVEGEPDGITADELERLTEVVKGVVGFSEARGDTVAVVPSSFAVPVDIIPQIAWWEDPRIVDLIKYGSSLVLILFILIFVARPIIKANMPEDDDLDIPLASLDGELSDQDLQMIRLGEGETLEEIKAKLIPKKSSIPLDMLDTANSYDDKVAVLRMLAADDPGRVANSIKRMIKTP